MENQDLFFIELLNKILAEYKECAEYTKNIHSPIYDEINEDHQACIAELTELLEEVHSIDDLAEYEEDVIYDVFEFIEEYASNFVISEEETQKKIDTAEYNKIQDLLNLFMDEDEEE